MGCLLTKETGHTEEQYSDYCRTRPKTTNPLMIAIAGPMERALEDAGQSTTHKARRKALERLGYTCLEWMVQGIEHGGHWTSQGK